MSRVPEGMEVGRLVLPRPYALIGRDRRTDVMLDHDLVSRRHAFLVIIEGWPFFIDLESRSGSSLADSPPREWGWLRPGQALQIGPYRIRSGDPGIEQRDQSNEVRDRDRAPVNGKPMPVRPPTRCCPARAIRATLPKVSLQFESRVVGPFGLADEPGHGGAR